jgi:hypothetical protein
MASKTIQTVLSLKDKFSKPVESAAKNVKQLKREMQLGTNTVNKFANNMNKSFLSISKTVAKTTGAAIGAVTTLAAGVGFKEAMDLEGYRLQLETATKDTQKAAQIMKYAVELANKTPFEGGELVEGAAMFEAMGMSAQKWLPLAGDMAAATNKDFMQATEALVDAQTGELERLKEFGIKKADIVKKAGEMFTGVQVVNNKDQIVDQEKFNQAMIALMQDKFTGGMEKQATTMKGLWSTVTGNIKSALSSIIGITEDGSIRQGSIYEKIKNKIKEVADTLTQWQNDGTIQKISDTLTNTVGKAIEYVSGAIKWLKDNMNWLLPVASGLLATFIAYNVINSVVDKFKDLSNVLKGVSAAQGMLNFVMSLNPIALVAIAIGVLIAAGVALWKNWDTISAKASELWTNIKSGFKGFVNYIVDGINTLTKGINSVGIKVPDWIPGVGGKTFGFAIPEIPKLYKGTQNWSGGPAMIHDKGAEIVDLPSGSRVYPHDKSIEIAKQQGNKTFNIIINKIADRVEVKSESDMYKLADIVAEIVAKKLKIIMANMV